MLSITICIHKSLSDCFRCASVTEPATADAVYLSLQSMQIVRINPHTNERIPIEAMNIPGPVNSSPSHHHSPNRPHGLPLLQPYVQPDPMNVPHSPPQRLSYSEVANQALGSLVALSRENDVACQQWYANEAERVRQSYQREVNKKADEHNERVARLIGEHIDEISKLNERQRQRVEILRTDLGNEKEEALEIERRRTWFIEGKLRDVNDNLQQVRYENEWITCSFDQKQRECKESTAEVVRMRDVLADSWRRRNDAIKAKAKVTKALADCEQKKQAAEEASRKLETDLTASKEAKGKADDKLKNLQTRLRALEDYEEQSDAFKKELQEQKKARKQELDECKETNTNLRFEVETQKWKIKRLEGQLKTAESEKKAMDAQKSSAEGNLAFERKSTARLQELLKHLESQKTTKEQELADKIRTLEEHTLGQKSSLERSAAELNLEKQRFDKLQRNVKLLLSAVDKVTNRAVNNARMLRVATRLYALASARDAQELNESNRLLGEIGQMTVQRGSAERTSAQPHATHRRTSSQLPSPVSEGVVDLGVGGLQSTVKERPEVPSACLEPGSQTGTSTRLMISTSSRSTDDNSAPVKKAETPSVEPKLLSEQAHQQSKDEGNDTTPVPGTSQQATQAPSIQASIRLGSTAPTHDPGTQQTLPQTPVPGESVATNGAADPKLLTNLPASGPSNSPPKSAPTGPKGVKSRKRRRGRDAKKDNSPNKKGRGEWDSYRPAVRRSDYEDARRPPVARSDYEERRHDSRRAPVERSFYEGSNPFRQRWWR